MGSILYKLNKFFLPFMGVPLEQAKLSNLTCNEWLKRILYDQEFKTNYFYHYYIYGYWTDDCCQPYLRKKIIIIL